MKTPTLLRLIGFIFLLLFLIGYFGSCQTRSIEGLGLAEGFAFIAIGLLTYAKKLEDDYIFCKN